MFLVSFEDGVACGKPLALKRAPALLRVVVDPAGGVDALDQLTDVPRLDEAIVVYRRLAIEPGVVTFSGGRGCAWFNRARYGLVDVPQPDDEEVRGATAWRSWAMAYRDRRA